MIVEGLPLPDGEHFIYIRENDLKDYAIISTDEGSLMTDDRHSLIAPATSEKCSSVHEVARSPAGSARHKVSRRF